MVRAGMPDYVGHDWGVGLDGTGVIAGDDRQSLQAGRVAGHEKPLKRGRVLNSLLRRLVNCFRTAAEQNRPSRWVKRSQKAQFPHSGNKTLRWKALFVPNPCG